MTSNCGDGGGDEQTGARREALCGDERSPVREEEEAARRELVRGASAELAAACEEEWAAGGKMVSRMDASAQLQLRAAACRLMRAAFPRRWECNHRGSDASDAEGELVRYAITVATAFLEVLSYASRFGVSSPHISFGNHTKDLLIIIIIFP